MKIKDTNNYLYSTSYWKMMTKGSLVQLLQEKNKQLYTTLRMNQKLDIRLEQLTEEVNLHYNQVLKEITLQEPIENLPHQKYMMAVQNRMQTAKEITMKWLLQHPMLKRRHYKDFA